MTIQQKLDSIKQVKATIKETLIDKGIEITANDTFSSFATKTNEVVTDTVLLNSLNAIKNVLIAKGIQATDDYSTYANLIEELDMGYEKHLINNGENGWYLLDPKTNWVKVCAKRDLPSDTSGWNDSARIFPEGLAYNKYLTIDLPFTFAYVVPTTTNYFTLCDSHECSYTKNTSTNDTSVKWNWSNIGTDFGGAIPLNCAPVANSAAEQSSLADYLKLIGACVIPPTYNKIYITRIGWSGSLSKGLEIVVYAEGMIL